LTSLLSLLERIPALLWATDQELRFTALTGAALSASGVIARDFTGRPVEDLFPRMESKFDALDAHRTALDGRACSFDAALCGRDFEIHVEPLCGPDGSAVGVIGVARDETQRLVAQRAVQLSEQNHRSLIEEAPYAICRATESGQLLQVNRAMVEMLGYAPGCEADLLVRDVPLIFESPEAFYEFRAVLLNGNTTQGVDTTWTCRGGQAIQVRIGGRAIRGAGGELLYLDILAEDVTERKQLEARLSQAEKMQAIGQLAGGVAHDFNNLLTVIAGQAEVLLDTTVDSEQRKRLFDIQQATGRASALTRQLLAFSRRQLLQSQTLNINRLIAQMSSMLTRLIRENIELTFVPGPETAYVKADPNQIEQVLMNLTVNAQDAMPRGGRITIETSTLADSEDGKPGGLEPAGYVCIKVSDTGHGMDLETQTHLFEPFFTTKKTGEGTGLGLATVYGIVRQSGGQIHVKSQPGAGSVFEILLPRVTMPGSAQVESAPSEPEAPPRGLETVLLAEDEEGVRNLVAGHLASLGYQVLSASDGEAALHLARSHSGAIDLLISDFVMPKMGGRELALELRKADPQIRVIFVSGYAGHTSGEQEKEFSGTSFLGKPFSMQELARTIRDALDNSQ
jgi:PAS domain S-box-containing protein